MRSCDYYRGQMFWLNRGIVCIVVAFPGCIDQQTRKKCIFVNQEEFRCTIVACETHWRLVVKLKNDLPQGINERMWKLFNWLARVVRCTAMVFNLMLCCLLSFSNFRYQQRRLQHRECRCSMSLSRGRMRKFNYFMESYNYHLVCRVMIHRIVARKSYCSQYLC